MVCGGFAFGSGAARVGREAFAARFIAAVRARASTMLNGVRTPWNALSVTSRMIDVSLAVIVRASAIDPAATPGPATTASHLTVMPRLEGRAASTLVAESDQRRTSVAMKLTTSDVRESATPTFSDP